MRVPRHGVVARPAGKASLVGEAKFGNGGNGRWKQNKRGEGEGGGGGGGSGDGGDVASLAFLGPQSSQSVPKSQLDEDSAPGPPSEQIPFETELHEHEFSQIVWASV